MPPPLRKAPSSSMLGRPSAASSSGVRGAKPPLSGSASSASHAQPQHPGSRPGSSMGTHRSLSGSGGPSQKAAAASVESREKREGEGIKVYVRVRGNAPNESPVAQPIISTEGIRGHQVHVALDQPVISSASSAAAAAAFASDPAQEKTYSFDGVFGPDADQGAVYHDVVVPILNDVLNGYKCTIFAYGQTGTGKTHTMEGNLSSKGGTYHLDAGIIPRTLDRLFHQVEMDKERELSVRATMLELYNEDLRDLLAPDYAAGERARAAGAGSAGAAGAASSKVMPPVLKIFDSKDGPQVQGVFETPISSAEEGLKLLRQGSDRRQVAATNCNDASSRSHSIFTLNVYSKDTGPNAKEDMYRVGKLYLVDLAGSESIERSGAKDKGAREAGSINKSLLTLGRVINALVEGSAHIPYRESNLTRLLQDSLGGGHKTSIIATISQAKSNLEETLSTLDYALRAKSIKNRPELNAKLPRTALMKDMQNTIKSLQDDRRAWIQQDGIYISKENHDKMIADHEAVMRERDEYRRERDVESSLKASLMEQVEHMVQRETKRQAELAEVKSAREKSEARARGLEKELEHEKRRCEVLAESEQSLYNAAQEALAAGRGCAEDNEALHAKNVRQEDQLRQVLNAVEAYVQSYEAQKQALRGTIGTMKQEVESYRQRSSDLGSSAAAQLASRLSAFEEHLGQVHSVISSTNEELLAAHAGVKKELAEHGEALAAAKARLVQATAGARASSEEDLRARLVRLSELPRAHRKEDEKTARQNVTELDELETLIGQLFAQLKALMDARRALDEQSTEACKAREEQERALLAEADAHQSSVAEQMVALAALLLTKTSSGQAAQPETLHAAERLVDLIQSCDNKHAERKANADEMEQVCASSYNQLSQLLENVRKVRAEYLNSLKVREKATKSEIHALEAATFKALEEQAAVAERWTSDLDQCCEEGRAKILEALEQNHSTAKSLTKAGKQLVKVGKAHAKELAADAAQSAASQGDALASHQQAHTATVQQLLDTIASGHDEFVELRKRDMQPYEPIGATPARKTYNFTRALQLATLPGMRSSRASVLSNASFSSQSSAAPAPAPRGSDLGRVAAAIRNVLPSLGGSSSPSPADTTATPLPAGGALQDLSKTLNLPRSARSGKPAPLTAEAALEDDEMDAVDTSLGAIKRPIAEIEPAPAPVTRASKRTRA